MTASVAVWSFRPFLEVDRTIFWLKNMYENNLKFNLYKYTTQSIITKLFFAQISLKVNAYSAQICIEHFKLFMQTIFNLKFLSRSRSNSSSRYTFLWKKIINYPKYIWSINHFVTSTYTHFKRYKKKLKIQSILCLLKKHIFSSFLPLFYVSKICAFPRVP